MQTKLCLTAKEVATCMSVSVLMAYKIIKQLNDEQKENGFITISGKVNKQYLENKIYGGLPIESMEISNASL